MLKALRLRHFRNFADLACEFPPSGVAIVGPNGSGKTNLLEAVYYLGIFRSFRGAPDAELVRLGDDTFRIEGTVEGPDGERTIAAAYQKSTRRKKVEVNGVEVERLSDALGTLGVVALSLADVELVSGPPAARRRFLDILLSLVRPGYLAALQRCRVAVAQRNGALRKAASSDELQPWTDELVSAGSSVITARAAWAVGCADGFSKYHEAISGGPGARLAYRSSVGPPAPGADARTWEERFREALSSAEERERQQGRTLVGPHRDDLDLSSAVADEENRAIRRFGSGGQQRTAALALRLVEADTLRDRAGVEPVYLLDDVFAELDRERSSSLLALLEDGRCGQAVLTAPKPADIALRGGLEEWSISRGRLEQ
ncbi:MAG: DNA replication and repair protein RecF [Gemmatimonadales bacterium]